MAKANLSKWKCGGLERIKLMASPSVEEPESGESSKTWPLPLSNKSLIGEIKHLRL